MSIRITFILITLTMFFEGCTKYLDKKTNKKLVVPATVSDLQALLDDNNTMNSSNMWLGETSADDYYLTKADWQSLYSDYSRSAYIWADEIVGDDYPNGWAEVYHAVYSTNIVLDNIAKVSEQSNEHSDLDNVRGSALFFRAFEFFRLAVTFTNSYDEKTADQDFGIPLRLNADFNETSERSTLRQTYAQIKSDLLQSIKLLPNYPEHVMRPSKCAAYGLLARVYLAMRQYNKASIYADSCLALNNKLLNFNDLNANSAYPINIFNEETIFYASGGNENIGNYLAKIDSNLYKTYSKDDLRKIIYFEDNQDGSKSMYGNYTGSGLFFFGLAVDEQYLIRAESLARLNKVQEAIKMLNSLLVTRWKSGSFIPFHADNSQEAIQIILKERRKELLMRDLRWQDIKRLNKEGMNISLKRVLGDETYQLSAISPRFALPLPAYIIKMTGMQQNPR